MSHRFQMPSIYTASKLSDLLERSTANFAGQVCTNLALIAYSRRSLLSHTDTLVSLVHLIEFEVGRLIASLGASDDRPRYAQASLAQSDIALECNLPPGLQSQGPGPIGDLDSIVQVLSRAIAFYQGLQAPCPPASPCQQSPARSPESTSNRSQSSSSSSSVVGSASSFDEGGGVPQGAFRHQLADLLDKAFADVESLRVGLDLDAQAKEHWEQGHATGYPCGFYDGLEEARDLYDRIRVEEREAAAVQAVETLLERGEKLVEFRQPREVDARQNRDFLLSEVRDKVRKLATAATEKACECDPEYGPDSPQEFRNAGIAEGLHQALEVIDKALEALGG